MAEEIEVLIVTTDLGKRYYCRSVKRLGIFLATLKNKDVQISYGKVDKNALDKLKGD